MSTITIRRLPMLFIVGVLSWITHSARSPLLRSELPVDTCRFEKAMLVAGPPLLFGVLLALYAAFWLRLGAKSSNPVLSEASAFKKPLALESQLCRRPAQPSERAPSGRRRN